MSYDYIYSPYAPIVGYPPIVPSGIPAYYNLVNPSGLFHSGIVPSGVTISGMFVSGNPPQPITGLNLTGVSGLLPYGIPSGIIVTGFLLNFIPLSGSDQDRDRLRDHLRDQMRDLQRGYQRDHGQPETDILYPPSSFE